VKLPKPLALAQRAIAQVAALGNALAGLAVVAGLLVVAWTVASGQPVLALGLAVALSVALNAILAGALVRAKASPPRPPLPILVPTPPEPVIRETGPGEPTPPKAGPIHAPPAPRWFTAEADPSSITITDRDLDSFAEAAEKTATDLLGPDTEIEFTTFQIYVEKGFMPSVNVYFEGVSAAAMKKAVIQFSLWASTEPGVGGIERLPSPPNKGVGPLRPWTLEGSWRELLRLAWLAERPFTGAIYIGFKFRADQESGQWECSMDRELEGVRHLSVEFAMVDGELVRL
jgi:hypothetical protein